MNRRYPSLGGWATLAVLLPALGIAGMNGPVPDEDAYLLDRLWESYLASPSLEKERVGLALGGGGSRGLAHIGILKVLEQERVPVDQIAGASVGALIGALYAAGVTTTQLETMARDIGWDALTNASRVAFVRLVLSQKLLSSERMESYLRKHIGEKRFEDLRVPFACTATDLQTGERLVFREGPVAPAARASATIPGLFEPVVFRHRFLVDGGLVGNVPTDLARALGADRVVAVDVSSDYSTFEPNNVLSTMSQAIFIQSERLSQAYLKEADLIIRPEMKNISPIDLSRSQDSIDAGVLAAHRAMPGLKAMLVSRKGLALLDVRRKGRG